MSTESVFWGIGSVVIDTSLTKRCCLIKRSDSFTARGSNGLFLLNSKRFFTANFFVLI